jgi:tRNA threonylcarbamoyladenosine biosynthesis protein TsaE
VGLALQVTSHGELETEGLAAKLAATFRPGDVLILVGQLGSGKTAFTRGLAKALGIAEDKVTSPSFTLVNEYPAEPPLYHFDLYRLSDTTELQEIGWEEYLSRNGIVAVEWGERLEHLLENQYYRITFTITGQTDRHIEIEVINPQ